ncbi:ATPase, partial [Salmonella enterica subsp. enterica serovar Give]|nr:ATPase [Salmonella enterica subsp. enterica serovar Give]
MSNKIENPVVLIYKRENSDSYAVAITSGSQDYHDAVLMAKMEPDMTGYNVDTWSKTGYYMAAEIERLRQQLIAPLSIGELLQRLESQTGEKWERAVNDVTTGKPLTITLP